MIQELEDVMESDLEHTIAFLFVIEFDRLIDCSSASVIVVIVKSIWENV